MDIQQAKQQIKYTMQAYFAKDEFGGYALPPQRQRPIFLLGAPGIGKKLAQRILLELKDKLGSLESVSVSDAAVPGPVTPGNAASEAAAALEVLGYSPSEIAVAMRGIDPALPTDEMVRLALRNMLAK